MAGQSFNQDSKEVRYQHLQNFHFGYFLYVSDSQIFNRSSDLDLILKCFFFRPVSNFKTEVFQTSFDLFDKIFFFYI